MWAAVCGYLDQIFHDFFFKGVLSTIGAVIAAMCGGLSVLVTLLFLLLCCDFLLGFYRAWQCGKVSGQRARKGVAKMVFYALAVFVLAAADLSIRHVSPIPLPVRDWSIMLLCVNEALSCLDHLIFFGVRVPPRIRERLLSYRDGGMEDRKNEN